MTCLAVFARQTRTRKRFDNGVVGTFDGGDGVAALKPPTEVYVGAAPRAKGAWTAAAWSSRRSGRLAAGRAVKAVTGRAVIHAGP